MRDHLALVVGASALASPFRSSPWASWAGALILCALLALTGCVSGPERTWSPCAVATCPTCRGHGDSRCAACGGRGLTACHAFNCNRGLVQCAGCNGSGKVANQVCISCAGVGKSNCWTCGGRGEANCTRCGGDGLAACPRGRWVTISQQAPAAQGQPATPAPTPVSAPTASVATPAQPPSGGERSTAPRATFCPECGERLGQSGKFCGACGAKVPG